MIILLQRNAKESHYLFVDIFVRIIACANVEAARTFHKHINVEGYSHESVMLCKTSYLRAVVANSVGDTFCCFFFAENIIFTFFCFVFLNKIFYRLHFEFHLIQKQFSTSNCFAYNLISNYFIH